MAGPALAVVGRGTNATAADATGLVPPRGSHYPLANCMRQQIHGVLDLWCWATFTEGSFHVTRFGCDERLAVISAEEFFRNSTDKYGEAEIPEGTEYLVPSRRYTDPEERTKRHAKYVDADKRPKGYLRLIELGLVALSASAGRKAHKAITSRRTTTR